MQEMAENGFLTQEIWTTYSKKNLEYEIMMYLNWKDKFHMNTICSQDQDSFCLGYHFSWLPQPPNLKDVFVYAFS
jgi:hypothetical protein